MRPRNITSSVVVLLVLGLAPAVRAQTGDYAFEVTLASTNPVGTFPITFTTREGQVSGFITLNLEPSGAVEGSIVVEDRTLTVYGKYQARNFKEKISLRAYGTGSLMKMKGVFYDSKCYGKAKGKGLVAPGKGTFSMDMTSAGPLTVTVTASFPDSTASSVTGDGEASGNGYAIPLFTLLKRTGSTGLKLTGGFFSWNSSGFAGEGTYTVYRWKCKGFGAKVSGYGGSITYEPSVPAIALLFVSGHGFLSGPQPYLAVYTEPFVVTTLERSGFTVETAHFIDSAEDTADGAGYFSLVATLEWIRDNWVKNRTRPSMVVIIAHSHGCVRAHGAVRAVPDLPVAALVSLDGSSCNWHLVGHQDWPLGGNPINQYYLGGVYYDLEDVVFDNVVFSLEVRTSDLCPSFLFEEYDDTSNIRTDGSFDGLFTYISEESHSSVYRGSGPTMDVVEDWLIDALSVLR